MFESHSRGQGFESPQLHNKMKKPLLGKGFFAFYRPSEIYFLRVLCLKDILNPQSTFLRLPIPFA